VTLFFTAIFSFAFQWYTLLHLPVVDCLPYKVGNNIPEKMQIPAGAIPDSTVITFVYNKQGKEVEFTSAEFPEDFDDSLYKFVKRYDKIVRKGNAMPKIKDFGLHTFYDNDTTQNLLSEDRYQLYLFVKDGYNTGDWGDDFAQIVKTARNKLITSFLVTSLPPQEVFSDQAPKVFSQLIPLRCDGVAVKTAARANPTLYLVKGGTIYGKWSYADLNKAMVAISAVSANPALPAAPAPNTTTPTK
jgi:hypothetical protein